MKKALNCFFAAMTLIVIASCSKGDQTPVVSGPFANGAFIVNEGNFGQRNASVSFYDYVKDVVRDSIYSDINDSDLGRLLQSMCLTGEKAYLVLNVSDTVVITQSESFKKTGILRGFSLPRYMTSFDRYGYISQWGENGVVKVVDLNQETVIRTVDVGTGPEGLLVSGWNVLVCNGGGYTLDSTVMVIDVAKNKVTDTIRVGYNPKEMVKDKNNDIWVVCYGFIQYDTNWTVVNEYPSKLVKLSGTDFHKISEFVISQTQHPQHIAISRDRSTVYFGGGFGFTGIYAMDITATAVPAAPFISGKMFYGFDVNPYTGDIFALDAGDFVSEGTLYRYSSSGSFLKQYQVGVAPNSVAFR